MMKKTMPPDGPDSWQQHHLRPAVAERVVADGRIGPGERVLEVGPGSGALTRALLTVGAQVAAIELDPQRAASLHERFATELADGRLQLLVGDARLLQPAVAAPWRVVANPPFQHTAELLRRWLLEDLPDGPPTAIDLVLQTQAVQKLCSRPPQQAQSGVLVQAWGRAHRGRSLQRDDVEPPSRVPLACLSLRQHQDAPAPAVLRRLDRLLAAGFAGPQRLRDALRGLATPRILTRQGQEHGYRPDDHPRTLSVPAWLALADFLHGIGRLE